MAKKPENIQPTNPNPDWQDKDINIPWIVITIAIVLVTTALTFVAMKIMMKVYKEQDAKREQVVSPLARERTLPPGPRLQVFPRDELAEHREAERERLSHYQWIDPDAGLAKIPIDRAVEIVVESGVPVFEPVPVAGEESAESSE